MYLGIPIFKHIKVRLVSLFSQNLKRTQPRCAGGRGGGGVGGRRVSIVWS